MGKARVGRIFGVLSQVVRCHILTVFGFETTPLLDVLRKIHRGLAGAGDLALGRALRRVGFLMAESVRFRDGIVCAAGWRAMGRRLVCGARPT